MLIWKRRLGIVIVCAGIVSDCVAFAVYQHIRGPAPLTLGDGKNGPLEMVWLPAGEFLMGRDHKQARPNEGPAHKVRLDGYWIDRYDVSNADFVRFIAQTHYVTTAERKPKSESPTAARDA